MRTVLANSLPRTVPRSTHKPSRNIMEMHVLGNVGVSISSSKVACHFLWGATSDDTNRRASEERSCVTFPVADWTAHTEALEAACPVGAAR